MRTAITFAAWGVWSHLVQPDMSEKLLVCVPVFISTVLAVVEDYKAITKK